MRVFEEKKSHNVGQSVHVDGSALWNRSEDSGGKLFSRCWVEKERGRREPSSREGGGRFIAGGGNREKKKSCPTFAGQGVYLQ